MLQQRVYKECGRSFEGGPRVHYCQSCRTERQKKAHTAFRRRRLSGDIRPLGSRDKCEECNKEYIVESGLQRFCPDCRPSHNAEYDRKTSLEFYRENKEAINPARNERRRVVVKSNQHGGKRLGAGRPATGAMPTRAIRMTDAEYELVKKFLADLRSKLKTTDDS